MTPEPDGHGRDYYETSQGRIAGFNLVKGEIQQEIDALREIVDERRDAGLARWSDYREAQEQGDAERDLRFEQRFLAQESALRTALAAMKEMLADRDLRYEQRFGAQEKATSLRADQLAAEFHEHLQQVRHENALAFDVSEKAIDKASVANEKRFDSVNEFRGQLADVINTRMPRAEAEQRMVTSETRVSELALVAQTHITRPDMEANTRRIEDRIEDLKSRVDGTEGKSRGSSATWSYMVAGAGLLIAFLSVAVSVLLRFTAR